MGYEGQGIGSKTLYVFINNPFYEEEEWYKGDKLKSFVKNLWNRFVWILGRSQSDVLYFFDLERLGLLKKYWVTELNTGGNPFDESAVRDFAYDLRNNFEGPYTLKFQISDHPENFGKMTSVPLVEIYLAYPKDKMYLKLVTR